MLVMKCPSCDNGMVAIFPRRNLRGELIAAIGCPRCHGSCVVDDRTNEWVEMGAILRERRRNSNLTLREASRRLDIDVGILSGMENGFIEPNMDINYKTVDLIMFMKGV